MEFDWSKAVLLFGLYIVFDALFAYYTIMVIQLKAIRAAVSSLLIFLISAFGIINFVENKFYVIPVALGGFIGTFFVIEYEKRKKNKVEAT